MLQDYTTYRPEEVERWIQLRALEWSAWPTFISQPVLPVLLIFFPWHIVLIGVLCADAVWQFLQHAFVSLFLSEISCLSVRWLMWPAALGSSIFLFVHDRYGVATFALLWPLVASFVTGPFQVLLSRLGLRRSLGSISLALAKKIGYASHDTVV
jgi:hypothetical protein